MCARLTANLQRTDVTPPKLDIIRYDREKSTPGYLFLAPYNVLNPMADLTAYVSHQAGPYIYDLDGVSVRLNGRSAFSHLWSAD